MRSQLASFSGCMLCDHHFHHFHSSTGGGETGDPHIYTLDGRHYSLLRQGTFLFWRFKKEPFHPSGAGDHQELGADWQVFTHYSGHASFAKGLLVLDDSSGSRQQALQLTSEDCKLRTRSAGDQDGDEWFTAETPTLFLNGGGNSTAINVTFVHKHSSTYFQSLMKMGHESQMREIAKLKVTCNPKHILNSWVSTSQKGSISFVQGQIGGNSFHKEKSTASASSSASFAENDAAKQNLKDEEFMSKKTWTELGGSKAAASYLQSSDETGLSLLSVMPCSGADRLEAQAICAKHFHSFDLMQRPMDILQKALADCVSDICGSTPESREVQAELAAEILRT